jgi:hypothetical protein
MAAELNMSYEQTINLPMTTILYLYAAVLERSGEDIGYKRTSSQEKAILNHMREALSDG